MQLKQLKVSNFRCYNHETVILTSTKLLVLPLGETDAGKSSLFLRWTSSMRGKQHTCDTDDISVHARRQ